MKNGKTEVVAAFCASPLQGLKGFIERVWWNTLRSPATIRRLLQLVYSSPAAVDEGTVDRILEATRRPLALDVFSAIFLAPRPQLAFEECLQLITAPVLMIYGGSRGGWGGIHWPLGIRSESSERKALPPYPPFAPHTLACSLPCLLNPSVFCRSPAGRDDPWVVPLWGQRLKKQVPSAVYLELSPAGEPPLSRTLNCQAPPEPHPELRVSRRAPSLKHEQQGLNQEALPREME